MGVSWPLSNNLCLLLHSGGFPISPIRLYNLIVPQMARHQSLSLRLLLLSLVYQASGQSTTPKTGWNSEGCYVDAVAGRTLSVGMGVTGGMTNAKCKDACQAAGYVLAGTEYAGECFCDNQFRNNGGPAPDGEVGCNMACNGNQTEMCGGSDRLTLFKFYTGGESTASSAAPTVAPSTAVTTANPSVPATSSSIAQPVATGLPTGFEYKGCYVDGPGFRIVNYQQPDDQAMTIASCANACAAAGYQIAAMEYSYQCFCDNTVSTNDYFGALCNTNTPSRSEWAASLLCQSQIATQSVQVTRVRLAEVPTG